ncbi:MAG: universal stress protein [Candidatus Methanomethylophilaceae archaeon]|jgi:nucleotide-binding universal stress UspA family protein
MSFQKILVPVDNDGYADDAVDKAIALAELSGGSIVALHVGNKADDKAGQVTVDKVVAKGKEKGVDVKTEMATGSPAEIILERSKDYDIIVMGTSGKKKILSGSVAKAVIRSASCPVIVVRSQR